VRNTDELWKAFGGLVARLGSRAPEVDTRVLFAGLHGLVSLHTGGRAEVARGGTHEAREATVEAATRLAAIVFQAPERRGRSAAQRAER